MLSSRKDALVAWLVGLILAAGIIGGARLVDVTRQIQQERYEQTYTSCKSQNLRHDATLSTLDGILKQAEKQQPKRAAQIEASRGPTVLLINALAPKRACTTVASAATH